MITQNCGKFHFCVFMKGNKTIREKNKKKHKLIFLEESFYLRLQQQLGKISNGDTLFAYNVQRHIVKYMQHSRMWHFTISIPNFILAKLHKCCPHLQCSHPNALRPGTNYLTKG